MVDKAAAEDVHKLRTTVRRLEVQLGPCPPKVAKSLKSLRRKAGRVRDIDVHLELLKSALFRGRTAAPSAAIVCDKLHRALESQRKRHLESLIRVVADAAPLLESRLPRVVHRAAKPMPTARSAHQFTSAARQRFLQWTRSIPEEGAPLHRLRIDAKKLRYSLEPLSAFAESAETAKQLKQVQDAIGRWHDWATLLELATHELGSPASEPAYAAMEVRTMREFNKARGIAERVRLWMSAAKPAATLTRGTPTLTLIRKAG